MPKVIRHGPVRTDLALEAREMLTREADKEMPGVDTQVEEKDGVTVTRVSITSAEAEQLMGKKQGQYVTLEAPGLREKDSSLQEKVSRQLTQEIVKIAKLKQDSLVLVVGLGNWNVTPDALGPRVVKDLLVTRHILKLQPETLGDGYRPVAAVSPGVLGITGVETGEIIQGLVEKIKPDLLIAVDALAARSISRLHTTIQLSDTGIHPGSGVDNKRMGISLETTGIPVLAMGVPTVVDAVTIADDVLFNLLEAMMNESGEGSPVYKLAAEFARGDKRHAMEEVMSPYGGNLMVTPKDTDELIEDVAQVLSGGINAALHPKIESWSAGKYLQ